MSWLDRVRGQLGTKKPMPFWRQLDRPSSGNLPTGTSFFRGAGQLATLRKPAIETRAATRRDKGVT